MLDYEQENSDQTQSQADETGGRRVSPSGLMLVGELVAPTLEARGQPVNTFVVLYDYVAQQRDEIQLAAGRLASVLDTSERDWWKICPLDGSKRVGYFPANYLAQLYSNERPLQVSQTIQVSNGETCDKLLRGQVSVPIEFCEFFRQFSLDL